MVATGELVARFSETTLVRPGSQATEHLRTHHDEDVEHFGKPRLAVRAVLSDKERYFKSWTDQSFTLGRSSLMLSEAGGLLDVSFGYGFRVSGAQGARSGRNIARFLLRPAGGHCDGPRGAPYLHPSLAPSHVEAVSAEMEDRSGARHATRRVVRAMSRSGDHGSCSLRERDDMIMKLRIPIATALVAAMLSSASADDGGGLRRGADPDDVSISGVSSGAAMAVQYAVAHSASVKAVGSIAGPQWGCAKGRVSRAVNTCMCGRQLPFEPTVTDARRLASSGAIDSLTPKGPRALKRSYVFQSPADETVVPASAAANVAFLAEFVGQAPVVDEGNAADHSNEAGHGIIAPGAGNDRCVVHGRERSGETFVRTCGAEDNVGKMFHALFGEGGPFDPGKRSADIAESELWAFDQRRIVEQVGARTLPVSSDYSVYGDWFEFFPQTSRRRRNFDMAATGYLYVPPACRPAGSRCRVHVALHGCKQDAKRFALKAGYNSWAEPYRTIVVYPALEPDAMALSGSICETAPLSVAFDGRRIEENPNGCWDWWGYLDPGKETDRYLTKRAPQMQVIEGIIAALTMQGAP